MKLESILKRIHPADQTSMEQAKKRWMSVAKPLFSLGKLEEAVIRMAGMKGTADYTLNKKGLLIFCADNGIVEEKVTQTGQEVTAVVAEHFASGDASVCIMSRAASVDVFPVDNGMARDVPAVTRPEDKVAYGTRNFRKEPAMTREETERAMNVGIRLVREKKQEGYEILATGEMGIGNTTTSSAVAACLLNLPAREVTGRGAGLDLAGWQRKVELIDGALERLRPDASDVTDVLSKVGGLDLAGMTGAYLGGAAYGVPIVIDGLISAAAALCAARLAPAAADYMLPSHVPAEPAGMLLLDALGLSPLLDCGMCLGEGSGAVAVMPVLEMGLQVYRQMGTFEEMKLKPYEILR